MRKQGPRHSRWCGYSPTKAPNFIPGPGTTLWWGRVHEIPYGERQKARKNRNGGTASGWMWPDCAEEFILSLRGSWFANGLPDEGTPFLMWTWQVDGQDHVVAIPTHEWKQKSVWKLVKQWDWVPTLGKDADGKETEG